MMKYKFIATLGVIFLINISLINAAAPLCQVANCTTCSSTNDQICTQCDPTSFLQTNGSCADSCPTSTCGTNTIACTTITDCVTCNTGAVTCKECTAGKVLSSDSSSCQSVCPNTPSCGTNTIPCTQISNCNIYSSTCTCQVCENNYFMGSDNTTCQQCGENCKNCIDQNTCNLCQPNYYLNLTVCLSSTSCPNVAVQNSTSNNNTCQNMCPGKQGPNENKICTACPANCDDCADSSETCSSCSEGFYSTPDQNNCVSSCTNAGYYSQNLTYMISCQNQNQCIATNIKNCQICSSGNSSCTTCVSGNYLNSDSTQCLNNCPLGSYVNSANTACIFCNQTIANCSQCQNSSNVIICTQCNSQNLISEDSQSCVQTCGSTNQCALNSQCVTTALTGCQTCQNNDETCATCQSEYYYVVETTSCVKVCPEGYYPDNTTIMQCLSCSKAMINCTQCSSATNCLLCDVDNYLSIGNSSCAETCSTGCMNLSSYMCQTANNDPNNQCLVCGKGSRNCAQCKNGYLLQSDFSTCLESCSSEPGTYANTTLGQCIQCFQNLTNCVGCTSSTVCTLCAPGSFLNNNTCVTACPEGTYNVTGDNPQCISCSSLQNCSQCSNATVCTQCITNNYLTFDKSGCVSTCDNELGTYLNSTLNQCVHCSSVMNNCYTCTNNTVCQTCLSGTVFNDKQNGCQTNCNPNECLLNQNTCIDTNMTNCLTCSNENQCLTCNQTGTYQFLNTNQFGCVSACAEGQVIVTSGTVKQCTECSVVLQNCQNCSDASTCTICADTYFLNQTTGQCVSPQNCTVALPEFVGSNTQNVCADACPSQYGKNLTNVCVKCSDINCLDCADNSEQCSKCPSNLVLNLGGTNCYQNCSITAQQNEETSCQNINTNTCIETTIVNCLMCNGTNNCTQCYGNTYLSGQECLTQCPSQTYPDNQTKTCLPCSVIQNCTTCTSNTFCTACASGSILSIDNQQCVSFCPSQNQCQSGSQCMNTLIANCKLCDDKMACSQCQNGFFSLTQNEQQSCVTNCPTGYYNDTQNSTCQQCSSQITNCSTCTNSSTCNQCEPTYYLSTDNKTCATYCSVGCIFQNSICVQLSFDTNNFCEVCSGNDINNLVCGQCKSGSFLSLNTGVCLQNCGNEVGTYQNTKSNQCTLCNATMNNCTACTSSTTCTTCNTTFFVNSSGLCTDNCGQGFFGYSGSCTNCSNFMTNCNNCLNPSTCTSCTGNFFIKADQSGCASSCDYEQGVFLNTSNSQCAYCKNSIPHCGSCNNASVCLNCVNGTYLQNNQCESECDGGSCKMSNGDCVQTNITNCLSCTNATYCDYCGNGQFLNQNNTQCVQNCSDQTGTYTQNSPLEQCVLCSKSLQNCASCINNSTCSICAGMFFLNSSNLCVEATNCEKGQVGVIGTTNQGNICSSTCPDGQGINLQTNICETCFSNCSNCSADSSKCSQCVKSFYLSLDEKVCSSDCSSSQNSCADSTSIQCIATNMTNCTFCSNATTCVTCSANNFFINGNTNCSSTCQNDEFVNSQNECQTCSSVFQNCSTCSNTSQCETCDSGLYLSINKTACLIGCGQGQFNNANGQCQVCSSGVNMMNCAACTDIKTCTLCVNSSYLYQTSCVSSASCVGAAIPSSLNGGKGNICGSLCPQGTGINPASNICANCSIANCDLCYQNFSQCTQCSGKMFLTLDQTSCVDNCTTTSTSITQCANKAISNYQCVQTSMQNCLICFGPNQCQQCYNNTYITKQGQCVSECPQGFYGQNETCIQCSTQNCQICNSQSCSQCNNSYFLNTTTNQCVECISNCQTCNNPTQCVTCSQNYHLEQNGTCTSSCPSGQYLDNSTNTCTQCNIDNCQSCSSETICTNCTSGQFLSPDGTQCLLYCLLLPGTFENTNSQGVNICQSCSQTMPNCQTCQNSTYCISCSSNTFKTQNNSMCVPQSQCPQYASNSYGNLCVSTCPSDYGIFTGSNLCQKCSSNCLNCTAANTCTNCTTSTYLENGVCITCPSGCLQCSSPTTCTQCQFYSFLNQTTGQCVQSNQCQAAITQTLTGGICANACPAGQGQNVNSNICQICNISLKNCLNCSNSATCTACSTGNFLNGAQCVSNCSAGQYQANNQCMNCSSNCQSCSTSINCSICNQNYLLFNQTCVATCPVSTFQSNQSCLACSANCSNCSSSNTCTQCQSNYFMKVDPFQDSYCVPNCTNDTLKSTNSYCSNIINQTCQFTQMTNCDQCNSSIFCQKCAQGNYFALNNSNCVSNCAQSQPGTFNDNKTLSCVSCQNNCLQCQNTTSCSNCSTGYFISITGAETSTCAQCSETCQSCYTQTQCSSCPNGFFLYTVNVNLIICQQNCTNETLQTTQQYCANTNTQQCLLTNMTRCNTCTANNSCTSCYDGTFMAIDNSTCLTNCTAMYAGTYNNVSTMSCSKCNNTLLGCVSCYNSSVCLECGFDYVLNNTDQTCKSKCKVGNCLLCSQISLSLCDQCMDNYYLSLDTSQCLNNCTDSSAQNTSLALCGNQAIPAFQCIATNLTNCLTCLGSQKCQECYNGQYLSSTLECVENCQTGYYGNSSFICVSCMMNCLACDNNSSCTSCAQGYQLTANHSKCVQTSSCSANCVTCSSPTQCTNCSAKYYLQQNNGSCVLNCESNQMLQTNNKTLVCQNVSAQNINSASQVAAIVSYVNTLASSSQLIISNSQTIIELTTQLLTSNITNSTLSNSNLSDILSLTSQLLNFSSSNKLNLTTNQTSNIATSVSSAIAYSINYKNKTLASQAFNQFELAKQLVGKSLFSQLNSSNKAQSFNFGQVSVYYSSVNMTKSSDYKSDSSISNSLQFSDDTYKQLVQSANSSSVFVVQSATPAAVNPHALQQPNNTNLVSNIVGVSIFSGAEFSSVSASSNVKFQISFPTITTKGSVQPVYYDVTNNQWSSSGLSWDSSSNTISTTHLTEFSLNASPSITSSGISGGGIAGIVIGVIAFILIVGGIIYCYYKKNKSFNLFNNQAQLDAQDLSMQENKLNDKEFSNDFTIKTKN